MRPRVYTHNPSMWEDEEEESRAQGQLPKDGEFEASLAYVRLSVKKPNQAKPKLVGRFDI